MSDRRSTAARLVRPRVLPVALIAAMLTTACEATSSSTSTSSTTGSTPTSTTGGGSPEYAAGLQASLEEVVENTTVPSAIVVVRSGQFGDATFTFGNTELGGTQPVTTKDHFRVGSATKTMTATVILQLVQEGRFALDDPVSKYISDVPDGADITIAQLLDMRSGLYSYTDDPEWSQTVEVEPQRVWTPQELLDIAFGHPADFAPDSNWHYTNTNYILLGMIMEQVTGQPASELFEQRLFAPLGMNDTVLPALEDSSIPVPFVHGYHYGSFDQALPAEQQAQAAAGTLLPEDVSDINASWGWTAGSVISTPDDLVVWVDALVSGTLLDPATQQLDSIRSLGPDYPQAEGIYGYGYGIDRTGSYYGHGGQITGYNTAMSRDPDTDTTVIVVATLTLAPDGTAVAPALSNTVIGALPDGSPIASTVPEPPGGLLPDD
ncbi:MAG: serine hydrolase domain-containing protein [Ilumatobacteraceae bacterium]